MPTNSRGPNDRDSGDPMSRTPQVGIDHLTLLQVSPPELVTIASETGFDAVGFRVGTAGPGEEPWPMAVGSPMLEETLRRMEDTGVRVLDVEVIRLGPDTTRKDYQALLESGQRLGARFINVMGVLVDCLHFQRCGDNLNYLRSVDPALLPILQLCDAPLAQPTGLPRPRWLPRGQGTDIPDAQLESRAMRLLPGDGELPVVELLAAMPAGIPISVEAPVLSLWETLPPVDIARRARQAVSRVLDKVSNLHSGPRNEQSNPKERNQ